MKITITRGATINLGSYESSRIDISIEQETGKEDLTYAVKQLDDWLIGQLTERVEAIQDAAGLPPQTAGRFFGSGN